MQKNGQSPAKRPEKLPVYSRDRPSPFLVDLIKLSAEKKQAAEMAAKRPWRGLGRKLFFWRPGAVITQTNQTDLPPRFFAESAGHSGPEGAGAAITGREQGGQKIFVIAISTIAGLAGLLAEKTRDSFRRFGVRTGPAGAAEISVSDIEDDPAGGRPGSAGNPAEAAARENGSALDLKKIIAAEEVAARAPAAPSSRAWRARARAASSFALILFTIALPFKLLTSANPAADGGLRGRVLGVSEMALADLRAGLELARDQDFSGAGVRLAGASESFREARSEIGRVNEALLALAGLAPSQELRFASEAKKILAAGETGAAVGSHLSLALAGLKESENASPLGERIFAAWRHSARAAGLAADLEKQAAAINGDNIPPAYREQFRALAENTSRISAGLRELAGLFAALSRILGFERDTRYLLVFQNNTEKRGSGGFIGSFALVDFHRGEIKNIEAPGGGSYDTEGGLKTLVASPEPLWLVRPRWYFWDANWWPDWPASARKLMWFYEKSAGPTVDGVIGFTPTVMEDLLRLIGPVTLGEPYELTVDADNFWIEIQALAERKPDESERPKEIIGDLMTAIIGRLAEGLDAKAAGDFLDLAFRNLREKHILAYFEEPALADFAERYGWDGKIGDTAWDYLMVVHTNIAGGKADRSIRETISHEAKIDADGFVTVDLSVKLEHTAGKGEPFTGVRYNDWLRVYVPAGSELLSAGGFSVPDRGFFSYPEPDWSLDPDLAAGEMLATVHAPSGTKIYREFGKTVFANWVQADPGQTVIIRFAYRLPFRLEIADPEPDALFGKPLPGAPYALLVQKQPGAVASRFLSRLESGWGSGVAWRYPAGLATGENGWNLEADLRQDAFYAVFFNKIE